MRHGEIALGVDYAASLRGRLPLGHPELKRVEIVDAEKKYAFGAGRSVVENWRSGMGGMKVTLHYEEGEEQKTRDWVVFPADLVGTWSDHSAQVKQNERVAREAKRSAARAQREKKALTKRLKANGFDVVANYGGDRWYVPTPILVQLLDALEAQK